MSSYVILPGSNGPTRQKSLGVNFQEMPGSDGDVEEERFVSAHFYRPGNGGGTYFCLFSPLFFGEMIQFDENMFETSN